ncbi:hypothetical protein IWX49DRAFT_333960 [Phyllosticta citricarpa]|uniref:Uncharacterized protein n=1 Tax=Phyllosticta citricarpa TaxID=55181 RepID=A0ABR1MCA8_9PEZI
MHSTSQSIPLREYRSLVSNNDVSTRPCHTRERKCCKDFFWTLEILSCVLAVLVLGTLAAILYIYDGQPQPKWPHHIGLNSVISIFTAAFKALLLKPVVEGLSQSKWLWFSQPKKLSDLELFDQASRGPWGSTCLIFDSMIKWRTFHLAAFGALLSIVALAIDPLSQGITRYYTCKKPWSTDSARVPRINHYTTYGIDIGVSAGTFILDSPMSVAIYMGLMNPPDRSTVDVGCSTGNCTFPTFSSLSMCSSCVDITTTVVDLGLDQHNQSVYKLPSGANVSQPTDLFHTVFTVDDGVPLFGPSLFEFEALMLNVEDDCQIEVNKGNYTCIQDVPFKPFAVRCGLTPCVKTYNASVNETRYQENVISSENFPVRSRKEPTLLPRTLVGNRTLRHGVWEDCKPSQKATESNTMEVTIYGEKETATGSSWYPPDCVWSFRWSSSFAINDFLKQRWSDAFYGGRLLAPVGNRPERMLGPFWYRNMYVNGTANLSTMNKFMEGLTLAMTTQIRQTPGFIETSPFEQGITWDTVTCVKVRWLWLLYPASLLCFTVVFLSLAIFQNRKSRQPWHSDWKSSSLALLFHGLEASTRDAHGSVPRQKDMTKAADQIHVQLLRGESGWMFSESSRPEDQEGIL